MTHLSFIWPAEEQERARVSADNRKVEQSTEK